MQKISREFNFQEVGSFESEKETDFSVNSTTAKTKSNVETKKKRKSQQEISTNKSNPAKKQITQSKDRRSFFDQSNKNKSNDQTRKTEPSKNNVIDPRIKTFSKKNFVVGQIMTNFAGIKFHV